MRRCEDAMEPWGSAWQRGTRSEATKGDGHNGREKRTLFQTETCGWPTKHWQLKREGCDGMGWMLRFGHLPFFLPLHVRIDAPLSRESRWRDGKEASRQAPVVEKGSSSARPGLDFPPFSPFRDPTRRVRVQPPSQPFQSGLICACHRLFGRDSAPNLQSQEVPLFLGRSVQ